MQRHPDRPATSRRAAELAQNPSLFVILIGLWLIVAPLALDHHTAETGYAGFNDMAVGMTLTALATVRVLQPQGTATLSLINALSGVWLVAAPFALGYQTHFAVTLNDLLTGVVVVMLAGVAWLTGSPSSRERPTSGHTSG